LTYDTHNIERYRVNRLKNEMNENLRTVISTLNTEQRELFSEEDSRCQILAHLEKVH